VNAIAGVEEPILVTGSTGFLGSRVVSRLLARGFRNIRCFARPASRVDHLEELRSRYTGSHVEIVRGNLLSAADCDKAVRDVVIVYHLAAGTSEKSFPDAFMNSVVTTRNLLDAAVRYGALKRFVNVSSLAVYSNDHLRRGALLDENCSVESDLVGRYDPYAYGKAWQDQIVRDYARRTGLRYVILRPGVTFGPGKARIPGRVGIDTFGVFLHLGHSNRMPLTYVDNCADAIVLAGLIKGIDAEDFNVIDDDLPTSREFLTRYKSKLGPFLTIPVPYRAFYAFCYVWERYSARSQGQLPPVFNRKTCAAYFKGNVYSNEKAKALLHWQPRVNMNEALLQFFAWMREHRAQA